MGERAAIHGTATGVALGAHHARGVPAAGAQLRHVAEPAARRARPARCLDAADDRVRPVPGRGQRGGARHLGAGRASLRPEAHAAGDGPGTGRGTAGGARDRTERVDSARTRGALRLRVQLRNRRCGDECQRRRRRTRLRAHPHAVNARRVQQWHGRGDGPRRAGRVRGARPRTAFRAHIRGDRRSPAGAAEGYPGR